MKENSDTMQEKGFGRYEKKGGSGVKKTLAQALLRGVNWEVG